VDATTQIITTVAGYGGTFTGDNVPATSTELNSPLGVTLDAQGNLYIADSGNYRVRRVDATTQIITTVAGDGTQGYSGDGKAAIDAELFIPQGLALDAAGNLYIADRDNYSVRGVDAATGIITTVAGNGTPGNAGNGGPAVDATLSEPVGLAMSSAGYLYIGDEENAQVRVLRPETLAATATTLSAAPLNVPAGQTLTLTATVTATAGTPTGTVTFLNGTASLGTGTLNSSGVATLVLTPPVGVYSITASYAGTQLDLASVSSPPIAVTVNAIVTTTTLTANPTTLNVGQTLTLTATVAAASGAAPTGTVTFLNGTATLGTGTLNASGVATLVLTPPVGVYSITASYGGSSTDAASVSSPPIKVTVTLAPTTTTLIAVPTTLNYGQTLTLTATVTASNGVAPTGAVTFLNGAATLGTGTLNASGVATLVLTPAVDTYSITASYGGSSTDAASVSSPPITVTVNPAVTTTTLIATPTTLYAGRTLTLTATVTAGSGSTPTGTVTFLNGAASLGTGTLNAAGVAALVLTPPLGIYSITAAYGGTTDDAPSVSSPPITVNVDYPATATVLTASPDPSPVENNVTFTATVSSSAGTPTGTVSFYDGTVLLGTSTLESGVATYSTSALTVGSHNITAQYPGVAGFAASTSSVVVEVITPPAFSISASPASLSVYTGEAATYTVTVTPGTGFTLPAALTCTQLPANTTCTFTPATVTGGSGSSKLVVQTTAPSPATSASRGSRRYSVVALAGLLLLVIPRRWRRFRNRWLTLFALLAFMIAAPAVSGCGGPFTLAGGTPVGAQTITVNGTVSYESQTLTHTATVTLNVESLF
jgi:sugar lactone lactonase YvrE